MMRILIYIEPVVFRANPIAGVTWVREWGMALTRGLSMSGNSFALASSVPIINLVRDQINEYQIQPFAISSWAVLSSCEYRRDLYNIALFESDLAKQALRGEGHLASLAAELLRINKAFRPDLVFTMGENKLLPQVFTQARILWLDRVPFLRQKRRDRLCIDPCGHQAGSALEMAANRIRELVLPPNYLPQIEALWRVMQAPQIAQLQKATAVQKAIQICAQGRHVALLVLQPIDWFSWEGCLGCSVSPEAMLALWADALPSDWVGIPLYKAHARLPVELEQSLAEAFPQLAFLPSNLSGNVAAWAVDVADAIVTVSSSMAGQALISGKQVVVVGRTPLRALAHAAVESLAEPGPTLTREQRAGLLAYLSHHYTFTLAEIGDPHGSFPLHLNSLLSSADPVSWLLDLSSWTPQRLLRLL